MDGIVIINMVGEIHIHNTHRTLENLTLGQLVKKRHAHEAPKF